MTYLRRQEPFVGDLPDVKPGDRVLCRTAFDAWVPKVAMSKPRYDHERAWGASVWMTVAVAELVDWATSGPDARWVNWPAEDVRRDGEA